MKQIRLSKEIEKNFKLTLTDKFCGSSLIDGYVFYKTEFENIWVTNYDILFDNRNLINDNLWIVFKKDEKGGFYFYLSGIIFEDMDYEYFKKEINHYENN